MPSHCPECRYQLAEDARHCTRCGARWLVDPRVVQHPPEPELALGLQVQLLVAGVLIGLGLAWFIGESVVCIPTASPSLLPLVPVGAGLSWYLLAERWASRRDRQDGTAG